MAVPSAKKKTSRTEKAETAMLLDSKMLQLLVCPLTKQNLELDTKKCELKSVSARLAYPIRGGIPILLPSEARSLDDKEL